MESDFKCRLDILLGNLWSCKKNNNFITGVIIAVLVSLSCFTTMTYFRICNSEKRRPFHFHSHKRLTFGHLSTHHLFTHLFNNCLLSSKYVPSVILGRKDTVVEQDRNTIAALPMYPVKCRKQKIKQLSITKWDKGIQRTMSSSLSSWEG